MLEPRTLPTARLAPADLLPPFAPGAAWSPKANLAFIRAEPQPLLQAMYFNSPSSYSTYVSYFHGVLRGWVAQADQAGIGDDNDLEQFLGQELQAYFPQVRRVLAKAYPGLSDEAYQILMAMNLATGYYVYSPVINGQRSLEQTVHLPTGDCTEIAELVLTLLQAQGISGRLLNQNYNYPTNLGTFAAKHAVVYADGLWIDAQINTAFRVDLHGLANVAPDQRLDCLLASRHVYGFYNWYLEPQVRAKELHLGVDGGIVSFYYQYYFAGIGNGLSEINYMPQG
jgi:hypothetical protein